MPKPTTEISQMSAEFLQSLEKHRANLTEYGRSDLQTMRAVMDRLIHNSLRPPKLFTKLSDRISLSTDTHTITVKYNPKNETIDIKSSADSEGTSSQVTEIPPGIRGMILFNGSLLMWHELQGAERVSEVLVDASEELLGVGELFIRLEKFMDPITGFVDSDKHVCIQVGVQSPPLWLKDNCVFKTDSQIYNMDLTRPANGSVPFMRVTIDFEVQCVFLFASMTMSSGVELLPIGGWKLSPIGNNPDEKLMDQLLEDYQVQGSFRS